MLIRAYQPDDVPQIVQIFYNTIHRVNCRDYTEAQINAWAAAVPETERWLKRYDTRRCFVADQDGMIAGFAELEDNGHIDCFYCHHEFQRQGVGRRLYERIEEEGRLLRDNRKGALQLDRLFVEVSITARPFFEQMGFYILHENHITINNVTLTNFSMAKDLVSVAP